MDYHRFNLHRPAVLAPCTRGSVESALTAAPCVARTTAPSWGSTAGTSDREVMVGGVKSATTEGVQSDTVATPPVTVVAPAKGQRFTWNLMGQVPDPITYGPAESAQDITVYYTEEMRVREGSQGFTRGQYVEGHFEHLLPSPAERHVVVVRSSRFQLMVAPSTNAASVTVRVTVRRVSAPPPLSSSTAVTPLADPATVAEATDTAVDDSSTMLNTWSGPDTTGLSALPEPVVHVKVHPVPCNRVRQGSQCSPCRKE